MRKKKKRRERKSKRKRERERFALDSIFHCNWILYLFGFVKVFLIFVMLPMWERVGEREARKFETARRERKRQRRREREMDGCRWVRLDLRGLSGCDVRISELVDDYLSEPTTNHSVIFFFFFPLFFLALVFSFLLWRNRVLIGEVEEPSQIKWPCST